MDQFTDDDFEGHELKMFKLATDVRKRNSKIMNELMQKFGQEPDVTNARIDHLLVTLTRAGLMTKQQYVEAVSDWEMNLNRQLQSMRDDMQNRFEKAQADQYKQRHLARPRPGIVLPNGQVHQPKGQS